MKTLKKIKKLLKKNNMNHVKVCYDPETKNIKLILGDFNDITFLSEKIVRKFNIHVYNYSVKLCKKKYNQIICGF